MTVKEKDMYPTIENTGLFAKKTFYYEIPIGDWATSRKKIDMVTFQNRKLVSIEVKVSNWRKALQQAYSNLYVSDYSYVALWHKTVPNVDTYIFKNLGIGILKVNGSCEVITKAKRSRKVIPRCRIYAKNKCKSKGGITT